jgi:hypothetical protein
VNSKKYDEMHVDGGVITEVSGYGRLFAEQAETSGQKSLCTIRVGRNGKLDTESQQVPRRVIAIVSRSFSTLMRAHSWNDLFRLYTNTERNGVDCNHMSMPHDYEAQGEETFDPVERKHLFDSGFDMAKGGYKWRKAPLFMLDSDEARWLWTPQVSEYCFTLFNAYR